MMTAEQIQAAIEAAIPGSGVRVVRNESVSGQHSLWADSEHAVAVATFLRDSSELRLDYCSNVTGVDWLDAAISEKVKIKKIVDDKEVEVEEIRKTKRLGYLECVYHLYSTELKQGCVTLRLRTEDRNEKVHLPSLTPVWRGAELQEREVFDLFGIIFDGHPDLRRLLMWEGFEDYPMRKDYVEPKDEDEIEPVTVGGQQ